MKKQKITGPATLFYLVHDAVNGIFVPDYAKVMSAIRAARRSIEEGQRLVNSTVSEPSPWNRGPGWLANLDEAEAAVLSDPPAALAALYSIAADLHGKV